MGKSLNKNFELVNKISLFCIACNLNFPIQNINYMKDHINYKLEKNNLHNTHQSKLISILHL
jgi:hypothetical protein